CGRWPGRPPEPAKPVRLGYLTSTTSTEDQSHLGEAFLQGMRDHGYVEGQNLVIERRWADRSPERLPALAAELVALPVDVIFAMSGTNAALAARQATSTIPIVSPTGDLVGVGLAASLARPGGNVTGLATISTQLSGKRVELLKETVPGVSRVATLWNPG